jgi:integrase/recombinase XerC
MGASRYSLNKNKYLLDPEFEALHKIATDYLESDRRNSLLILIALHSGARATELLNLRRADVNTYDKTLLIRGIKGSNDREIPISHWLFGALEKHLIGLSSDRLFPISYSRLVQIWEHYRPVHKKFHSLRHTFAIRLYKKTKDLRLVQVALGHRNITNTMIYADYVYSQQELRRLIL